MLQLLTQPVFEKSAVFKVLSFQELQQTVSRAQRARVFRVFAFD